MGYPKTNFEIQGVITYETINNLTVLGADSDATINAGHQKIMKILNLHFKNINSLAGEHRINFEQPPFSDSGVFAITGPNGSGKSSVLDAITLGLYGETFRFHKPAEFVMTKQTGDCFAEVEFALGADKYKSSWTVRREQNSPEGTVQAADMQLLRLSDGGVLASSAQQVCAEITSLTGMNFRNFTRSVMLAQGDFAVFLNALDSERMDILEKIAGVDIYAEYKQTAMDKAEAAQAVVAKLQAELATIQVLAPEKEEACQLDLQDFQHDLAELEAQQSALNHIAALETQIAGQERNLKTAEAGLQAAQNSLAKIDGVQDARLFTDTLAAVDEKNRGFMQGKAELAALQAELSELLQMKASLGELAANQPTASDLPIEAQKLALERARVQFSQLRSKRQAEIVLLQSLTVQQDEKSEVLATITTWLQDHSADAVLLDDFPDVARLKKLRADIVDLTGQQKKFTRWDKATASALANTREAVEKASAKVAEASTELAAEEKASAILLDGHDPDAIDELMAEQQERTAQFQELFALAEAHQRLTDKGGGLFGLFKAKEEAVPDEEALAQELADLGQEIRREENIALTLKELITQNTALKKMVADRNKLVSGKPCPLCGSTEHPFSKRPPIITDSRMALRDQQVKLKIMAGAEDRLKQRINFAQKSTEKNKEKQAQIQQIKSQWSSLSNRLNAAGSGLTIYNLSQIGDLLEAENLELKNISNLLSQYRRKQFNIGKLQETIEQNKAIAEAGQAELQQLAIVNPTTPIPVNKRSELEECHKQERELSDKLKKQLTGLGEKMPGRNKEDALYDRLNVRRQEYYSYVFRRSGLDEEIAALVAKQQACLAEISQFDQEIEIYAGQLQAEERLGLHLALIEKQKLIADKEQILARQESEFSLLQQGLQENLAATRFADLDTLRTALVMLADKPAIEQSTAALMATKVAAEASLEQLATELAASLESAQALLASYGEDQAQQQKNLAEKIALVTMECQHLQQLLDNQGENRQQYQSLLAAIEKEEERAAPYLAELAEINAETGIAYRRRVQTWLAGRLLSQTNTILEKISGRYYLRQATSEQGLSLEIEDTYQANARRLPKTLSGGESFVVSLALALGLSELASNGRTVDSLFLDEGFGNLDADSLYTVISTLENLQTHGKTVGVISHVDAVQKRIKAQLQVAKKADGFGELRQSS